MKKPRVPDKVTSPVKRLRSRIAPNEQLQYVKVLIEPDAEINECFSNLERKTKRDGGGIQYGWAIWYLPGILMEAEFHAVWVSPKGELIDVTPRQIQFKEMLFLPDSATVYSGRQIDNIRIPLKRDPRVKEYIRLHEELFKILNEGELANKYGPVSIPRDKIDPVRERLGELSIELGIA